MEKGISERLLDICTNGSELDDNSIGYPHGFGIDNLSAKQVKQIEFELINHFKFTRIVWMEEPVQKAEDGVTVIMAKSVKLSDEQNTRYENSVAYVHQVTFTPKVFDPAKLHTPVKDGCVMTPLLYNPESFEPYRSITLTWSPEMPQKVDIVNGKAIVNISQEEEEAKLRMKLVDTLGKVLSNPKEYEPPYIRVCIVRMATL